MLKSIVAAALVATAIASPTPQIKGAGCKKIALIFARGSTETGTMGITVGPALQRGLEAKYPGQVSTQGVRYPADIGGAVSGAINPFGAAGAKEMTKLAKAMMQSCPDTKIVLSGYSQGAEQVHGALGKANLGDDGAKIAAAVVYGDPMAGPTTKQIGGTWGCLPEERAKVFCNKGDGVCTGQFSISGAHLSYTSNGDIGKGVSFVQSIVNGGKLGGGECKYTSYSAGGGKGGAGPAPKAGGAGGAPKGGARPPKGAGAPPKAAPPKGAPPSEDAPPSEGAPSSEDAL